MRLLEPTPTKLCSKGHIIRHGYGCVTCIQLSRKDDRIKELEEKVEELEQK